MPNDFQDVSQETQDFPEIHLQENPIDDRNKEVLLEDKAP